jgi:hypothetical protein
MNPAHGVNQRRILLLFWMLLLWIPTCCRRLSLPAAVADSDTVPNWRPDPRREIAWPAIYRAVVRDESTACEESYHKRPQQTHRIPSFEIRGPCFVPNVQRLDGRATAKDGGAGASRQL